jgi:hypothetical protein
MKPGGGSPDQPECGLGDQRECGLMACGGRTVAGWAVCAAQFILYVANQARARHLGTAGAGHITQDCGSTLARPSTRREAGPKTILPPTMPPERPTDPPGCEPEATLRLRSARVPAASRTADLFLTRSNVPKWSPVRYRKTPLTCRAPLRNRTVDLLLTI